MARNVLVKNALPCKVLRHIILDKLKTILTFHNILCNYFKYKYNILKISQ